MTCRMPSCDNPTGQSDRDDYRARKFCSPRCDVKHDHLKADAEAERRSEEEEAREGGPVAYGTGGP